jgi:hypothetical protein
MDIFSASAHGKKMHLLTETFAFPQIIPATEMKILQ